MLRRITLCGRFLLLIACLLGSISMSAANGKVTIDV